MKILLADYIELVLRDIYDGVDNAHMSKRVNAEYPDEVTFEVNVQADREDGTAWVLDPKIYGEHGRVTFTVPAWKRK